MRFHEIVVSGIENIVIEHGVHWRLAEKELWVRVSETAIFEKALEKKTHAEMTRIVNILKRDRRYRMWVHFDTLNIVRK